MCHHWRLKTLWTHCPYDRESLQLKDGLDTTMSVFIWYWCCSPLRGRSTAWCCIATSHYWIRPVVLFQYASFTVNCRLCRCCAILGDLTLCLFTASLIATIAISIIADACRYCAVTWRLENRTQTPAAIAMPHNVDFITIAPLYGVLITICGLLPLLHTVYQRCAY